MSLQAVEHAKAVRHRLWNPPARPIPKSIHPQFTAERSQIEREAGFLEMFEGRIPSVREVVKLVAAYYRISVENLVAMRRVERFTHARQVAMYLARELTDSSMETISRRIGDRDHTTVLHGHRKIQTALDFGDEKLASEIRQIKLALGVR